MAKDYNKLIKENDEFLAEALINIDLGTLVEIKRDIEHKIGYVEKDFNKVVCSEKYFTFQKSIDEEINKKLSGLPEETLFHMKDIFYQRLENLLEKDIKHVNENKTFNLERNGDERTELKIEYYTLYQTLVNMEISKRLKNINLNSLDSAVEGKYNNGVNNRY